MILTSLVDYYNRKAADPESGIAPPGWEVKEIPYIILLNEEGIPVNLISTYEGSGKEKRAKKYLVPQSEKRVGVKPFLLWDNLLYVVGVSPKPEEKESAKIKHRAFCQKLEELSGVEDQGLEAVRKFLAQSTEEIVAALSHFETWKEACANGSAAWTFQLAGATNVIATSDAVRTVVDLKNAEHEGVAGRCLVTGQDCIVEDKTHPPIKGVFGGQGSGTNIICFDKRSFRSFNKEQGANAPVGKSAVFAYTTALNTLLDKDSQNRMQVGEASTVFWGERSSILEEQMVSIFSEPPKDDPDQGVKAVRALYESVQTGAFADEKGTDRFYVLGLSPNAARVAIRFWIVSTVHAMANNILRHFEDTKIVHGPKEKDTLSLFRFLVNLATEGKADNIPPMIEGDFMRAILENLPYPRTMLQAAIRRSRAEQNVNYPRAAIIKACINRQTRYQNSTIKEELKVALDLDNKNIGYRLGRLFAALEKIQAEANPGLNATIRDRYYGAASGTPVTVFPNLMRLKNHHLSKLDSTGRRIYFEKLLAEISSEIADFPRHLPLEDQGRFAIGYYHQMQQFFTKKEKEADKTEETVA